MLVRPDNKKQWVIMRDKNNSPARFRHMTQDEAVKEAERLAKKYNDKFTIFESTLKVDNRHNQTM